MIGIGNVPVKNICRRRWSLIRTPTVDASSLVHFALLRCLGLEGTFIRRVRDATASSSSSQVEVSMEAMESASRR